MIKVTLDNNEDYFSNTHNFIINYVGLDETINDNLIKQYPHVEKEYLRYLKYCSKNHINIIGSIQYVPVDTWALIMCDTMKNNNVFAYDSNYQYIVNIYCPDGTINVKTLKKAFSKINILAQKIEATISIPYDYLLYKTIIKVDKLKNICTEIFNSNLDVEIINYESIKEDQEGE